MAHFLTCCLFQERIRSVGVCRDIRMRKQKQKEREEKAKLLESEQSEIADPAFSMEPDETSGHYGVRNVLR